MNEINRIFAVITLMLLGVVSVSAYTEVPGISGPTWQDLRESYGGKGTKEEPYVIERPTQLAQLAYEVNTDMLNLSGKYFILGADIDLSSRKMQDDHLNNVVPSWVPIGIGNIAGDKCFKGIFSNPHGYVIKNMIIRVSEYGELKNYGLFGRLKGHIDGLRMKGVTIEGGSDEYCGAVCGNADNGAVMTSVGNCLVEDVNIFTYDGSVGGIAGVVDHCLLKNCVVKGATLQGLYCGGIVGYFNDEHFSNGDDQFAIDNCHSVADIRVSGAGNYYGHGHAGGIVGSADGNPKQVIQYCSASGSITTVSKNRMGLYYGGLVGFLHHMNVENSCSSVTLSEGTIMGGLVGCMKAPSNVLFCFANGYIDATLSDWKKLDAWGMYAGGLVGYIDNNSISEGDVYLGYSLSAGSMLEPQEIPDDAREYYTFGFGSVVGYAKKSSNFGDTMNGLTVDKNLCRLPAIPAEFGEIADVEMMKTKELTSDDDPYKSFYKMPIDMLERYKKQYNTDVAFPDNFMLAAVPFYVKDEHFAHYNVWQVTTKFDTTPLAYNRATQKALASFYFQQRQDDLDFLNIEEDAESAVKTVTPLDPGEADVVVEYAGLHRTIHLDITYGVPWNDKEPKEFPGGNGAKNDPYIIQNVSQLITAANSEVYNRDDMYFRLSNDIFFNTHLIQKDEKAKAGAKPWTPVEWHANLDGNGKTLYGLYVSTYVNKTYKEEDPNYYSDTRKDFSMSGLFSELFGHVHDMAIVDSYVNMNLAGTSLASLCTGLYAGLIRGGASIERCLAHGIVLGPRNMCGGFVGFGYQLDGELGNISDCFSCVHVMGKEWGSSSFSSGTAGGGITGGWAAWWCSCRRRSCCAYW